MNLDKIEKNLKKISSKINEKNFIYDFLLAYGLPKSSINRLKKGSYDLSKTDREIIWNKKIYFKALSKKEDAHDVIDEILKSGEIEKYKIRFVIVTDFKIFLSSDIKANDTLDINISELQKNYDFFLPLIGQEKFVNIKENLADIKAADKLGKLYEIILKENQNLTKNDKQKHGLNIFLVRLVFCFFAEDSEIFEKGLFTKILKSLSKEDGSNLGELIDKIFTILNTENRESAPNYLNSFPYVNGGLFKNDYQLPKFSKESRKMIINLGLLDWGSINPDILGSMMQSIVLPEHRSNIGMHYTSVQNILKVIKPLFLDDLYERLNNSKNENELKSILKEIYNINIFDPACGSGNFLVISYKELCRLEIEVLKKLKEINHLEWSFGSSGIVLTQFYGIEIEDFAHEIAKIALWLAEHQMNLLFNEIFGSTKPSIPLRETGKIICGNALKLDWMKICPNKTSFKNIKKKRLNKIYIIGNPPYKGARKQTIEQKKDMHLFKNVKNFKNLDYVAAWFLKAGEYINKIENSQSSFVSTSSLFQGEQISLFWQNILDLNLEITYAHKNFLWTNNAKGKAGVTCSIVALSKKNYKKKKYIYEKNKILTCSNINPYLVPGKDVIIYSRQKPLDTQTPEMIFGSMPNDSGNLILNLNEKNLLIETDLNYKKFIKPLIGSHEFFNGIKRFCFWLRDIDKEEYKNLPELQKRIEKTKQIRSRSDRAATKKLSNTPHLFGEIRQPVKGKYILYPSFCSEKRDYVPIDFLDSEIIATNTTHIIPNATLYDFGVIESKMHMAWMKCITGRLKNDYNYSVKLVFNNFPWPSVNFNQKKIIEECSIEILEEREKFPEKTFAQMYNKDTMPKSLLDKHIKLDNKIDKIYTNKILDSDNQRLEHLFDLYLNKIKNEKLF